MGSADSEQLEGYPWLSWAMTGVLTLAAVLVVGLVMSARYPRSEAALPVSAAKNRDSAAQPAASNLPPATTSAPVTSAAPATTGSVPSSAQPEVSQPDASQSNAKMIESTPAKPQALVPAKPAIATGPAPAPVRPAAPMKVSPPPAATPAAVPVKPPPAPAAIDAAKQAAFVKAVADVRRSMASRDLAAAKRHLQSAESNAQSEAEHAEFDRLQTLQDHVEQFWKGIRDAVAKMEPTEELVLGDSNRVAVIEASREELSVQVEGRPHRYRVEALPMNLLSAIAKASIKQTPDAKLIVGAFLAMDAQGDRNEARKLWREAIAAGESEGKQLMAELDVPRAGK